MDQARLQQEYANLAGVYDPQEQLIQQQMAQLPIQAQAQRSALEQAKVNAFRDINSQAQGRGVFFSGFRPEEQARYTGATFLPALAEVEGKQLAQQSALQQALLGVRQQRQQQAQSILQAQLDREQAERQFRMEQEARAREAAASRAASSASSAPAIPVQRAVEAAFVGYDRNDPNDRGLAEALISRIISDYNIGIDEAARIVYGYRKKQFGE